MLRKEEILSRTNNGLSVFKHYLPGNWRIGRNFLNPLYEDSKELAHRSELPQSAVRGQQGFLQHLL